MTKFKEKKMGGFIPEKVKPLDREFGMASPITQSMIFPSGNVKHFLPEGKEQVGVYFDDWGCVSHAILNAIKTYLKAVFPYLTDSELNFLSFRFMKDDKIDFSHRDLVVLSGTIIGTGNWVSKVIETVKEIGVIPYDEGPWDFSNRDPKVNIPEVYFSYKRTDRAEKIAKEWKDRLCIETEWVHRNLLESASKYGTIVLAVNAWYQNSNGEFYNPTGNHNHLVMLASYHDREIFDSYKYDGSFIKKLSSWDDIRVWATKINVIRKHMSKPQILNNTLVQLVTPDIPGSGQFGLYLDDRIMLGDVGEVLGTFYVRNNGKTEGKTLTLEIDDWNKFDKVDMSGNKI